jgi:hypothetical protein
MTISSSVRLVYDEAHYQYWTIEMLYQEGTKTLMERLSHQELMNHISTVFYCDASSNPSKKLGDCSIAIHVGKENSLQTLMRERGIKGIVGLTPKNPIQNPSANSVENQAYVERFQSLLDSRNIDYTPANGRARDFKEGGSGGFLLIDVSPEEVISLLQVDGEPTQLSITYLPAFGKAQLISCIEPKPKAENRLKTILKELTQEERALALSFLGAKVASSLGAKLNDYDYPLASPSPRLLEFLLYVRNASPSSQVKLIGVLSRLLSQA